MDSVIIIGAGISGLSAAKLLHESNLDVLVLEARGRVGGRTWTRKDVQYKYYDAGGSYVGPTQARILRLADELGVKTFQINSEGDSIQLLQGKISRSSSALDDWYMNPFTWLDVNNLFRDMETKMRQIPLTNPWEAPEAEQWDNISMKEYLDQMCWTREAKEQGFNLVPDYVTMEASEVSLLWFLWYVAGAGQSLRSSGDDNVAQERQFVGGSNQITEKMAELLGDKVHLNEPVSKITDNEGIVTVESVHGHTYTAKHVIIAVSPTLHQKFTFDPPLSPIKNQLIKRLTTGSGIKTYTFYKKAFWKDNGYNGYSVCTDGTETICVTAEDTKPDGSVPALSGFIADDKAREMLTLSHKERKQKVLEFMERIFQTNEALEAVGYEETNWMAEPYTGGCNLMSYPPGLMTRFGREIRCPHGNIYFAGTETAAKWAGSMDGAVEAGERAAREVLHFHGLISVDEIWRDDLTFKKEARREVPPSSLLQTYAPSLDTLVISAKWFGIALLGSLLFYSQKDSIARLL